MTPHIADIGWYTPAVQRFMYYIDLAEGVRIATVHVTANGETAVREVKEYIGWLDQNSPSNGWILTGDFNSRPVRYPVPIPGNPAINISTNKSQTIPYKTTSTGGIYFCNLLFDVNPTQGPGGTRCNCLDYTFYREPVDFQVLEIRNRMVLSCRKDNCIDFICPSCIEMKKNCISDHNLIQTIVLF